jgi:hypothetical protein
MPAYRTGQGGLNFNRSHWALLLRVVCEQDHETNQFEDPAIDRLKLTDTYGLTANKEMLLTPYFLLAPSALSEMNKYCGLSCTFSTRRPAASIVAR